MSIQGRIRDIFGARGFRGEQRPHFNGKRFANQTFDDKKPLGPIAYLKKTPWQKWQPRPNPKFDPPPRRVMGDQLAVTFVNHATFLIQIDGLNILTDPVWGRCVKPVLGVVGPRARFRDPGLSFENLPPIDCVLVSHNHRDHMEVSTLAQLSKRNRPRFFVGLGNTEFLQLFGVAGSIDLDWYERSVALTRDTRLHFVPAHHGSQRGITDKDKTLWGGFVLEHPRGCIFFAGDTGWGPHFAEIAERFPKMRLSLLPIGDCYPADMFSSIHIGPREALAAHKIFAAEQSVAYHHNTFRLTGAGQDQAHIEMTGILAEPQNAGVKFYLPEHGQVLRF